MMFFRKKKKKSKPPESVQTVRWIVLGFAVLAILKGLISPDPATKSTMDSLKTKSISGFQDYKQKVFLSATPTTTQMATPTLTK